MLRVMLRDLSWVRDLKVHMLGMLRDHKGAQRVREYIREASKGD
jgi:hypothetical protein